MFSGLVKCPICGEIMSSSESFKYPNGKQKVYMDNEIITCNSTKSDDVKDIEKAIEKLKLQEKRLVDLYLSSNLDVETINHKNDVIKKEIHKNIYI